MSRRHFIDNAPTPTFGPIGTTDVTWTISAAAGLPTSFPFNATLDLGTASQENVSVTGISGTTVTAVRNIDGLGAFSHATGATLNHTALAVDFDEANAHVNASTGVHGITGAVVGTTDTQTLSNKTIAGFTGTANSGVVGITVTGDGTGDLLDLKKSSTIVAKVDQAGNLTAVSLATGGTAAVTGAATFGSTVGITGTTTAAAVNATNVAASGTLGVTGVSTLHGVVATTVAASGNSTIGGTLGVTGATTAAAVSATTLAASSTLAVTGTSTLTGNVSAGGTLGVTGAATVGGTLGITGATTAAAVTATSLSLGGWTTYTPTWTGLTVGNGTLVASYLQVDKALSLRISLTFGSTTTIASAVSVSLPSGMLTANDGVALQTLPLYAFTGGASFAGLASVFPNAASVKVLIPTSSSNTTLIQVSSQGSFTTSSFVVIQGILQIA